MGTRFTDEDLMPKEEDNKLSGSKNIGGDGALVRSGGKQGADGDLPEQDKDSSDTKGPSEN